MKKLKQRALWCALVGLLSHGYAAASDIPLDIIQESNGGSSYIYRLGINVGVNGGTPQEYLFDTGSDSFNIDVGSGSGSVSWFPNLASSVTSSPYLYAYGDGTYGYWQQNATVSSIQFYSSATGSKVYGATTSQGLPVAAALDWVMTSNQFAPNTPGGDTQGAAITTNINSSNQTVTLYQDLTWQQLINQGSAPEEGHYYGTFGAGDFVYPGDNGGPPGMLTTTGYIVEANGKPGVPGGCGQACFILGLTPALRAQFLSVVPWVGGAQGSFNLSGANAAQQFDTLFNYTLNNGKYTATLQTLLDSGTPTIYLNDNGLLASETNAGHINANGNEVGGVTLTMTGASPGSKPTSITTGDDSTGDQSNVVTPGGNAFSGSGSALYGVSFFMNNAVMYDLQNQATAYTPFYVTDAALTTDFTVTAAMGPLGLAGTISGAGPFTVASGGIANLSGTNTYTGATVIAQGGWLGLAGPGSIATSAGVQADGTFDISRASSGVGIQSLSGAGTVYLGGSTLELTQASGSFSGQLSDGGLGGGTGGGLIVANGMETLTGNNTYSGLTGISPQGALNLQGSVAGSVVDTGTLLGNGSIGGGLMVAGTVAPGTARGTYQTLNVAGNYTQAAGATYVAQWNLAQAGASSQIAVGGTATLATGAIVDLVPSASSVPLFQTGSRYTLLTANSGLSGTYTIAGDTTLSAVLKVVPQYDADHFYLDVVQQRSLVASAQTRNQTAVLEAVQGLSVASAPFIALTNLQSDAQIRAAADQLSGEIYASAQNTFLEDSRIVRDAVTGRLRQADASWSGAGGASTQPAKTQANGVTWWGQFVGSWGHQDSTGNDAAMSRTLGGFLVGADMPFGENTRAGVVSGYTKTAFNVNQRGSSLSSDDGYFGAYAGTRFGALGLSAGVDYTQHAMDTTRTVAIPDVSNHLRGSADAHTTEVFGEAAYQLTYKKATLEPFAQAAYVRLDTDGFQERGGAMALTGQGNQRSVTYTTLGAHSATHFIFQGDAFTAHATLGWRHAFGNVQPDASMAFADGGSFTVQGLPISRNALIVDAGLDLAVNKSMKLGISYDSQIAAHAVDAGFRGNVTWQF
ncbi:autotransporter outer membrane beta-barrel domain-containing protein [Dyella acidisoli]|uniref:Autotransporter domain-containing protein n=1 Tax=Dyella acidisoli TaxID=1867834 RepID=A0ABQ5XZL8_9GAMM|nr:autotransporter domain-containing protein [Dyella acidisoli]GLQ95539.1 hypothetical protein GCM10007901_44950 [Dyella acidisoli]